ncbi:MAG: hypothetical protein J5I81_07115 [Nitrococcus mobilis]|nr:hypothetical protein [Nitrococcus mobilis]
MPGTAIQLGAADAVVALDDIAQRVLQLCVSSQPRSARSTADITRLPG